MARLALLAAAAAGAGARTVADRLGELPLTREAFWRGELSYRKVSTLMRVAEPANEEQLVELAGFLTESQLERAVGAYRRVSREEAADQQDRGS